MGQSHVGDSFSCLHQLLHWDEPRRAGCEGEEQFTVSEVLRPSDTNFSSETNGIIVRGLQFRLCGLAQHVMLTVKETEASKVCSEKNDWNGNQEDNAKAHMLVGAYNHIDYTIFTSTHESFSHYPSKIKVCMYIPKIFRNWCWTQKKQSTWEKESSICKQHMPVKATLASSNVMSCLSEI